MKIQKNKITYIIFPTFCFFILFFLHISSTQATITKAEAQKLLSRQFIEQSEKNINIYMQSVNVGMTSEQALNNINKLQNFTSSSPSVEGLITGGQWSYIGDVIAFTPNASFIAEVPEKKRNYDYTRRRIDGIEEVVDESTASGENYNDVFDKYKKALGSSKISGTRVGELMLKRYRDQFPKEGQPRFHEEVNQMVKEMNEKMSQDLFNKVATVAQEHGVDIDDVTGYMTDLQIPGAGYTVKIKTADGKIYPPDTNATNPSNANPNGTKNPATNATGIAKASSNPSTTSPATTTPGGSPAAIAPGGSPAAIASGGGSSPTFKNPIQFGTVDGLLENILTTVQGIVAVLATVMIVIGGIIYITSAGDQGRVQLAKTAITSAIIGLAIAIAAPTFLFEIYNVLGATNNSSAVANATPLSTILFNILNLLLGIIGTLSVLMLVIGGIMYMTSAGDQTRADTAKKTIQYSIAGLAVAVLALVIVRAVASMFT
ncbi:MAG: hypothetical protein CR972_04100 [Candidatus Moraniibacteriota bacterium]|nr:MAG: hypothetical protein CR972_04100 [Candidatus Moranbacteria bacterium]